jgi:hypothetical protein
MLTLFVFTNLRELISSLIVRAQCSLARGLGFFLSARKQTGIVTRSLTFVRLNRPVGDLLAVSGFLATVSLIAIALVAMPARMAAQDQPATANSSPLATVLPDQWHFYRKFVQQQRCKNECHQCRSRNLMPL